MIYDHEYQQSNTCAVPVPLRVVLSENISRFGYKREYNPNISTMGQGVVIVTNTNLPSRASCEQSSRTHLPE